MQEILIVVNIGMYFTTKAEARQIYVSAYI